MAKLDTVRSALRNAVRVALFSGGPSLGALTSPYPHGGTELGEVEKVVLGVQDKIFVPYGWEFGAPVDHGYREGQTWVLSLKIRGLQDADWRALAFGTQAPTDAYYPQSATIREDPPGFVPALGKMILLSPVDLTHDAVLCLAPVRAVGPAPINWGSDRPAEGDTRFTLGYYTALGVTTKGVVMVDRLEHLAVT